MNRAINPFNVLPFFDKMEDQTRFRHRGAGQVVPCDRLVPFQVIIQDNGTPSAVIVKTDGSYLLRLSPRVFDVNTLEDGRTAYTYRGEYIDVMPEGEYYVVMFVNGQAYYSECVEALSISVGQRLDIVIEVFGASYVFFATEILSQVATDRIWEFWDGTEWIVVNTGALTATISGATVGADGLYKVRYRVVTTQGEVSATYMLLHDASLLERSRFFRFAEGSEIDCKEYWHYLEFWNDSDDFGILYERGYKQRVYFMANFDTAVIEQEEVRDERPDGTSYLRSVLNKPRQQVVANSLPDYLIPVLSTAMSHDNIRLVRCKDGISYDLKEADFEPTDSENPVMFEGVISYISDVFYRSGARGTLNSDGNDIEIINPVDPLDPN